MVVVIDDRRLGELEDERAPIPGDVAGGKIDLRLVVDDEATTADRGVQLGRQMQAPLAAVVAVDVVDPVSGSCALRLVLAADKPTPAISRPTRCSRMTLSARSGETSRSA